MYQEIDIIDIIQEEAKKKIIIDREQYFKFFKIIEKYIFDNHLIVGGLSANQRILNNNNTDINFQYETYSETPNIDAKKLSKLLFDCDSNGLSRYTNVNVKIPLNLYSINVNTRELIIINKLPIIKGIKINQNLIKINMKFTSSDNKLLCMGLDIQLIQIYSNLINPATASIWTKLLFDEQLLRKKYIEEFDQDWELFNSDNNDNNNSDNNDNNNSDNNDNNSDNDNNNSDNNSDNNDNNSDNNNADNDDNTNNINGGKDKKDILYFKILEYINNSNRILIGSSAINFLKTKHFNPKNRLQIITCNKLEDEAQLLVLLGKKINIQLEWNIGQPRLIDDFYLKKLTIYSLTNHGKKLILDIFNSGSYELISYKSYNIQINKISLKEVKIGSIYILMKFRLIDIWIIKLLFQISTIEFNYMKKIIKEIQEDYIKLNILINTEKLYQLQYIGKYEDKKLVLRRTTDKLIKIAPRYYPLQPTRQLQSNIIEI